MEENKEQYNELKNEKSITDRIRDAQRKSGKVGKIIKNVVKAVSALPVLIKILLLMATILSVLSIFDGLLKVLEMLAAKDTMEYIYEEFEILDITELVELTGDSSSGYYWQFKSDVDEKLEDIVDKVKEDNPSIMMKDASTLKKFMEAEVVTQLPNLGSISDIDVEVENQDDNSETTITSSSLDKFLFIGDSITVGLQNSKQIDGKNCKYVAETGISTQGWINAHFNDLPKNSEINGICIMLGVNGVSSPNLEYSYMQDLIKKLHEKYPDKPIFVQKLLPTSGGYDYLNSYINTYNQKVKEFCKNNSSKYNVKFIDTTASYVDGNGKLAHTSDGLHPNNYAILAKNIKNAVTGSSSGTEDTDSDESLELGVMGDSPFQGVITVKRITPDKEIGEKVVVDGVIKELSFVEEEVFNALIENNDKRALEVYTLNSKKNIIIASWSYSSEVGITITKGRAVNYSSVMEKYSMPFEYLLSFLIDGEDIEFTEALAQLALDSEIVIAIQDTVTTTETVQNEIDEYGNIITDDYGNPITYTVISETNSTTIELTYADCWFVKFYKDQSYSSENSEIVTDSSSDGSTVTNKYDSGESHAEGNERKFIDLFRNSKIAINTLEPEWLYDLLEQSSKTSNMIELTKYLFACVKDEKNIGNEELFDFSIYEDNKFTSVGSGIYGGTIQEKVWWALIDAGFDPISVAGAMGNIHYESGGFSASAIEGGTGIGIGLAQWSFGRRTALENYAASKGVDWSDEDTQVEFLVAELTGGGANGCATDQFSGFRSYENAWKNAETVDAATEAFCYGFERPNASDASSSMPLRKQYANYYYDEFKDKERPSGAENILAACEDVMETWASRGVRYSLTTLPSTPEKAYSTSKYACCATYVSTVLYKAGLLTEEQITKYAWHYTGNGGIPDMLKAAGWTQVDPSEKQPGDVINNPSVHVVIYAGGNLIYDQNCGVISSSGSKPILAPFRSQYATNSSYQVWRAP